ncbi:MAG TPA: hypothetical protein VFV98_17090 [Vicinamibacterales bacterium]|nr:hypothetical protein [Vicinamibacterales bacterium]
MAMTAAMGMVATAAEVTFVLKNGERHSGTLVYHRDANINLRSGGNERSFPQSDIALIQFVGGDPSREEVARLPEGGDPPELDRNTVVLRNGDMIRGKVYIFNENDVVFDTRDGRRTFNMGDIARIYMSAPAARSLFPSTSTPSSLPATGGPVGVRVAANEDWADTGLTVRQGQRVAFEVTGGEVRVVPDRTTGPDGDPSLPRPRTTFGNRPSGLNIGQLVGRIGNGGPFPIGSNREPILMGGNGRLYLSVYDTERGDNSGGFIVKVTRR